MRVYLLISCMQVVLISVLGLHLLMYSMICTLPIFKSMVNDLVGMVSIIVIEIFVVNMESLVHCVEITPKK